MFFPSRFSRYPAIRQLAGRNNPSAVGRWPFPGPVRASSGHDPFHNFIPISAPWPPAARPLDPAAAPPSPVAASRCDPESGCATATHRENQAGPTPPTDQYPRLGQIVCREP